MAKSVWTCRGDEAMSVAARLMWEHDIGAVPVLDRTDRLVGIVTDRDLLMGAFFTGEALAAVPVEHAMSRSVFTVTPAQRLDEAEALMRSNHIRRLPVVEGGKVVGMITLSDLARAAQIRRALPASEVNATLAAIVEPRHLPGVAAA